MPRERVDTEGITERRLERWAKSLSEDHATPVLLVGVGHDEKSGALSVCTCADVDDERMELILMAALKRLRNGETKKV